MGTSLTVWRPDLFANNRACESRDNPYKTPQRCGRVQRHHEAASGLQPDSCFRAVVRTGVFHSWTNSLPTVRRLATILPTATEDP